MKTIYKYDQNGFFILQEVVDKNEEISGNYTTIPPMKDIGNGFFEGYYKAKFINGEWKEGATSEEIKKIKLDRKKDSVIVDFLELETAYLWYENMMDKRKIESNEVEIASLWYEIAMGGM